MTMGIFNNTVVPNSKEEGFEAAGESNGGCLKNGVHPGSKKYAPESSPKSSQSNLDIRHGFTNFGNGQRDYGSLPGSRHGSRPGSRPQSGGSFHRKSAWERAEEKFQLQQKDAPPVPPEVDDLSQPPLFSLKTLSHVFKSKKFKEYKLESLYQRYFFKLSQTNLTFLMGFLMIICGIYIACHFIGGSRTIPKGVILSTLTLVLLILVVLCQTPLFVPFYMHILCYVLFGVMCCMVLVVSIDSQPRTAMAGVWATIFFIYMAYTLIPVRMRLSVGAGVLLAVLQTICAVAINHDDAFLGKQVG